MKKKGITLVVSIVALAALSGAYFALRSHNQQEEEREAQEASGETILSIDTEKIAAASFNVGGVPYTFEKTDDTWVLADDDSFPVDKEALEDSLSHLSEIKALRTLEEIDDTAEFGMDAPQNDITLKMTDGTETHLTIGDTNEGTGNDYLMIESAPSTVYTIETTVRTAFSDDLYDYALSEELPALTKDNITGIELDGGDNTYALYKEDGVWKLRDDANANAAVDDLLTQLSGLFYSDYLEHNCADLSPYGLDEPAATLTVTYETDTAAKDTAEEKAELAIKIGGTDEAGNYYTQLADSTQVHTISAAVIDALLNATPETLEETETETQTDTEVPAETEAQTDTEMPAETEA